MLANLLDRRIEAGFVPSVERHAAPLLRQSRCNGEAQAARRTTDERYAFIKL
jgi:hypothetical protein